MPLVLRNNWKRNLTPSRPLSVSHLFTFLNSHLIPLSSSLVSSPYLYHTVEVMTINLTQEKQGQPFKRGKLLPSFHATSKSPKKSFTVPHCPPPPPAPGAHCWSSSRGRIALATAMLMEVVTHGKEQFSFQKRSFIGGRENCQLSTPVCPALF